MGLCSVVLFEHEIGAGLFEKYFDQVGAFPVVINNQDTSLFFDRRPGDCIDLSLIKPINATQRWILTNNVLSNNNESVRVIDDLYHYQYIRILSDTTQPELYN